MPADPVSLCVWHDAKADPPTGIMGRQVLTLRDDGSVVTVMAVIVGEGYVPVVSWAELPVPPGDDPLTTDHLRVLAEAAEYVAQENPVAEGELDLLVEAAARLRRAVEQQGGNR